MQSNEPLVCVAVETHVVSGFPVVEGATKLNLLVPWSKVVHREDVRELVFSRCFKVRLDLRGT